MNKGIAFFDFDGTITTKDTLLEFIKFVKGNFRFYLGFLIHLPYLVAFKLGIISNQKAKERILHFFFNNMPISVFNSHCERFATNIIPGLIRPDAQIEIEKLKHSGITIVIVSASPENWVKKWADKTDLSCISTILTVKEGRITGKIDGNNCNGQEKVLRIKLKYNLDDYEVITAYGNSKGDIPMLNLATKAHFKPFCS